MEKYGQKTGEKKTRKEINKLTTTNYIFCVLSMDHIHHIPCC